MKIGARVQARSNRSADMQYVPVIAHTFLHSCFFAFSVISTDSFIVAFLYLHSMKNAVLMLMGSADALPQAPSTHHKFIEDMSETEAMTAVSTYIDIAAHRHCCTCIHSFASTVKNSHWTGQSW